MFRCPSQNQDPAVSATQWPHRKCSQPVRSTSATLDFSVILFSSIWIQNRIPMDWISCVARSCLRDLDLCWATPEVSIPGRSMSQEMPLLSLTTFALRGDAVILKVVGVQAPLFRIVSSFLPAPFLRLICYLVNRCLAQALGASTVVQCAECSQPLRLRLAASRRGPDSSPQQLQQ